MKLPVSLLLLLKDRYRDIAAQCRTCALLAEVNESGDCPACETQRATKRCT
jgi:hypothetical protein